MGSSFPAAAYAWLAPPPGKLLAVGTKSIPFAQQLVTSDRVTLVDPDAQSLWENSDRLPSARMIAAHPEKLPLRPQLFSAVLVSQCLQTLPQHALPSLARSLSEGGQLLVHLTVRDDTVPWVQRLAEIVRKVNPTAMTSDGGLSSLLVLDDSPHFPKLDHKTFRMWVPVTKNTLLKMVKDSDVDDAEVLDEVSELYDSLARPAEPLRLPYTVHCWRSTVDHTRVKVDLLFEDSLRFRL
ncbi:MAG: methyltransferase domain-containing protein [Propionibacteriaceae bacterium]|nr:methyltransferase domain-containing protein [Propionibacteriaceae bacterium]